MPNPEGSSAMLLQCPPESMTLLPHGTDGKDTRSLIREVPDEELVSADSESWRSRLRFSTWIVMFFAAVILSTVLHKGLMTDGGLRSGGLSEEAAAETKGTSASDIEDENEAGVEELVVIKGKTKSREEVCPGCTDSRYRCVVINNGAYSQCIDCSPGGNWKNDCPVWSEILRKAAVKECGLACGDMKPPHNSRPAIEPYCNIGPMEPDYAHERCIKMKDHSLKVACDSTNPNECGVQLSSQLGTGGGLYTVAIQAARGAGLSSKFYLYTYGFSKDRRNPWNEISLEVLGKTCKSSGTVIYTDFIAGPFNPDAHYWGRETAHPQYLDVPFDACEDWHTYSLDIENNTIVWMVDDEIYRSVDISAYDDLIKTLYEKKLQARLTLVGQDETAGKWDRMGYLNQNTNPFPIYAWFANIEIPTDEVSSSTESEDIESIVDEIGFTENHLDRNKSKNTEYIDRGKSQSHNDDSTDSEDLDITGPGKSDSVKSHNIGFAKSDDADSTEVEDINDIDSTGIGTSTSGNDDTVKSNDTDIVKPHHVDIAKSNDVDNVEVDDIDGIDTDSTHRTPANSEDTVTFDFDVLNMHNLDDFYPPGEGTDESIIDIRRK